MAEAIVKYTEPVRAADGTSYLAQACGDITEDGLWEGWIEFVSDDRALRTGRETEQPNRNDLIYWAEGLTYAYLEGALARALVLESGPPRIDIEVPGEPVFDGPAEDRPVVRRVAVEPRRIIPHAILDPYVVFAEGENVLRQQLRALSRDQLVNIVRAYDLADTPASVVDDGSRHELAEYIVRAMKRQYERKMGKSELEDRGDH